MDEIQVLTANPAAPIADAGAPVAVTGAAVAVTGAAVADAGAAVAVTGAPVADAGASAGDAGASAGGSGRTGWSLSPSRAADFMTCPLLYRFRVIDRLPEAPSPAAARGTLVHAVLERLFDAPSTERNPAAAADLIAPAWEQLIAAEPSLAELFADDAERETWLTQAKEMLDRYFTLEDPTRLEPAHRELHVEAVMSSGLRLRGYIDRVDIAPSGEVRIVDYKTGTAPREEFEARALFQMKFYALVLWRIRGTVPRMLQLIYLGNGELVRYAPDEADLLATERKVEALWRAIERARDTEDWRARPGRLCSWCAHQQYCPEFGGTPPPLPTKEELASRYAPAQPSPADAPHQADAPHMADVADLT